MAGQGDPVVGNLGGKGQVVGINILSGRLGEGKRIKHIRHLVAMPGPVDVSGMFGFGYIIEPVAPARLPYPLLGLHHDKPQGGEGHIAAYLTPQFGIVFDAGIEQLDQPQSQPPLPAQLLDLSGEIDAKHRHHARFIAVGTDHDRHRMVAGGKKDLQHRLRQHTIPMDRRGGYVVRCRQRPESLRWDRPQLLCGGVFQPKMGRQRLAFFKRLLPGRVRQGVAALDYRLMKQPLCQRRGEQ